MPITHTDGQSYFSAAEVETTIKDRLKGVSTRADELDAKVKLLEPKAAEVDTWKNKALAAERKLVAVDVIGSTVAKDPDALWLLEATHERVMSGVEEAKRVDFNTWASSVKMDPNLAPAVVRHLFQGDAGGQAGGGAGQGAGAGAGAGGQAGGGAGQGAGAGAGGGAGGEGAGGQGAAGGAGAGAGVTRPAWAPAVTGQHATQTGGGSGMLERVGAATSIADLVKLSNEIAGR